MKRILISLFLICSITLFATDVVISDFESGFVGTWGTNGNSGTEPVEDNVNFSIVDNPSKDDINSSDKVAKFIRLQSGNWWALSWFEFDEIEIEASINSPKYLHISFYKPVSSTICVQIKDTMIDPVSNTGEITSDAQTKVNEWQDVVYKITTSGTFKLIEVKPDFVNAVVSDRLDSDIDIYIDNIVINDDPTPLGEEPEPEPDFLGYLPEGFEGENTLLDTYFYGDRFGTFGQEGASTDLTVVDNPSKVGVNTTSKCAQFVRKVSGEWWAGLYLIPANSMELNEDSKYMHIMIYRESEPAPLSLKLENGEGDTGDILIEGDPNGTYDWVDYVFECPADKYGTYDKIAFMPDFVEDPAPSSRYFEDASIYFDAIEISNDPEPRTSAEIAGIATTSTQTACAWKTNGSNLVLALPTVNSGVVNIYNVVGELVSATPFSKTSTNVTLDKPQQTGIYIVKIISTNGAEQYAKIKL